MLDETVEQIAQLKARIASPTGERVPEDQIVVEGEMLPTARNGNVVIGVTVRLGRNIMMGGALVSLAQGSLHFFLPFCSLPSSACFPFPLGFVPHVYRIAKNSWGPKWGEQGFVRVRRNINSASGICGLAIDASFPKNGAVITRQS